MSDEPLRLLADGMLGRLAKWLRLLGYDTAYENAAADPELARRARAERRVLLTRDRELARRRGLHAILVQSQVLAEQVRQVQVELGPPPGPALSRCTVCNAPLEPIAPTDASGRVPPYVLETHAEFHRCPCCGRIYWPGSHVAAIRSQIEELCPEEPAGD
jgi:uncharacterized protein with PIN domain